ncbi:MAG TPA: LCP family protein [Aeromicrobium sp.]|nr:LCP family protein [Aeromicrobium sp.]
MSRLFNRKRYGGAGKRREGGIPFHQRHRKAITRTLTAVILIGLAGVGYAYNLNRKFQNIDRVKVDLNEKNRPDPDKGQALNLLLLGSDKGETSKPEWKGSTLADDVRSGDWPSGKYRSDTIMIVHISEDRKHVYLVSIPRDSFTMLYDEEGNAQRKEKVNAAFSYYGPTGAISTIEHLSDLRMKHMAIIDWDGFKDLTTALGGVEIYIPETFRDPKQKVTWESGTQLLKGNKALAYVRTRYGLAIDVDTCLGDPLDDCAHEVSVVGCGRGLVRPPRGGLPRRDSEGGVVELSMLCAPSGRNGSMQRLAERPWSISRLENLSRQDAFVR